MKIYILQKHHYCDCGWSHSTDNRAAFSSREDAEKALAEARINVEVHYNASRERNKKEVRDWFAIPVLERGFPVFYAQRHSDSLEKSLEFVDQSFGSMMESEKKCFEIFVMELNQKNGSGENKQ